MMKNMKKMSKLVLFSLLLIPIISILTTALIPTLILTLIPTASAYWVSEDIQQVDFYLVNVSPQIIEPGQSTLLNITVKNMAPAIAVDMNATLDPYDISPIDPIGIRKRHVGGAGAAIENNAFMGVIQNENITISIPVYVNQSTPEGVYQVPLMLYWEDKIRVHWSQTLNMGIQIKGSPMVKVAKVSTTPVEFRPDTEKNKVIIKVENAGKTIAKSVKINANIDKPFSEAYSGSSSDFISQILPDESHDFIIALDIDKGANPGEYSLPLNVTYRAHDNEYNIDNDVKINIDDKADFSIQSINSSPQMIYPGDDFVINILIKNVGQEKAENVKAVINTKSYFTGVKTDYLGEIKVGETKVATFDLTADRDTIIDNYENDLKLIWNDGDDRLEEITSFGITISKKNDNVMSNVGISAVVILVGMVGAGIVFKRKIGKFKK